MGGHFFIEPAARSLPVLTNYSAVKTDTQILD